MVTKGVYYNILFEKPELVLIEQVLWDNLEARLRELQQDCAPLENFKVSRKDAIDFLMEISRALDKWDSFHKRMGEIYDILRQFGKEAEANLPSVSADTTSP